MSKKIKNLVVDTTAFIKAANLQEIAEEIYTVEEVVQEITNDRQRKKLVVLPYDLKIKDVFAENVKFVTDFAKKTGDYTSLSATDIKVMALAYQMEKEQVGTDHLRTEPTMQRTFKVTGIKPKTESESTDTPDVEAQDVSTESVNADKQTSCSENVQTKKEETPDELATQETEITEQIKSIELSDSNDALEKVSDEESGSEDDGDEDEDSDGGEWITPANVKDKKRELECGVFEDKEVAVACITSDFAMQNVLKQIGLNVTAVDGRIIRQLRTFIFRCTTCFKTTSVMTKLFCPKCGHASLKKVAVSIDDDGNQHIHINGRKPLTSRGKRFSLPTPKGGQHFQYPILTEDQHIHKRFATKIARNKTNPLDPDYIAGYSPFVMKDVNSKSAVLGVRADKQDIKYWMKHYSKGKK